jgi:hypothetical protein
MDLICMLLLLPPPLQPLLLQKVENGKITNVNENKQCCYSLHNRKMVSLWHMPAV